MSKAYKILPNEQCPDDLRFKFEVKCGCYVKLSGYGLCPGICLRINQIHEDKCNCIYDEKPYCLFGEQLGMDSNCTETVIPMPGCYVAYLCIDEDVEWDVDDFAIYMDTCKDLENLQTVLMALGNN
jgi:hypothetical protein